MILLDIGTFLGRLHPLLVHLPIGFLLLAAVFHGLATYSKKHQELTQAIPVTLALGAAAAIIACFLGWLLSNTGDYSPTILENHKFTGIGLAIISSLLFFLTTEKVSPF